MYHLSNDTTLIHMIMRKNLLEKKKIKEDMKN